MYSNVVKMKILNAIQFKEVDQLTIAAQHISSLELMERASFALTQAIERDLKDVSRYSFVVLCGSGNNGGDGLAVARMLLEKGADVQVYLLNSPHYSEDNLQNQEKIHPDFIKFFVVELPPEIDKNAIILDCLFGVGLSRPLDESYRPLIESINNHAGYILSADLPSGLQADVINAADAIVVKATKIYTFHSPKLAMLLPQHQEWVDTYEVIDIRLDPDAIRQQHVDHYYVTEQWAFAKLKTRNRFSHKGTFGHALLIGGSYGKIGAVRLSATAAARSGCGLVTVYIPGCGYTAFQAAVPEIMVLTDSNNNHITNYPSVKPYSAIGVGIGMGQEGPTGTAFVKLMRSLTPDTRLVLDADALNLLATRQDLLANLPPDTILTPHPKELKRLIGEWTDDRKKIEKVRNFASLYKVIVIVKGANTMTVVPDGKLYFNSTGNAGMATGGSGDVLTGIITSLLAQGYSAEDAAILAVYLHGAAGDEARKERGEESLIASDIITCLSTAFQRLRLSRIF
ncbi:NAD(P)H-hydrate dehydratase [Sphingobacterium spiritivorum]|nr:NAD(P)H-hydrate dehydratase [Sphingobacterium spiritivorum]